MERADSRRVRRISHGKRLAVYLALVAGVGVGAFVAGASVSTPTEVAVAGAETKIPVRVVVEERQVESYDTAQGVLAAGQTISIGTVDLATEQARKVVTEQRFAVGDVVTAGQSLGSVSDRPLILLELPTPFIRDLKFEDRGPDVNRFQRAMQKVGYPDLPESGVVDEPTLLAVQDLYTRNGASAPGATVVDIQIKMSEFVALPTGGAEVTQVSTVGSVLDLDSNFAELRISPNYVSARVNVLQVDAFEQGLTLRVQGADGFVGSGVVESVSDFAEADPESGLPAGYDLVVVLEAVPQGQPSLRVSEPVTLSTQAEVEATPAVPLIAIRQNENGPFVVIEEPNEERREVQIVVLRQGAGWAAVEGNPDITPGTMLLVDV